MPIHPTSPAFIVIFMFGTFLVYGGWALFRRPRNRRYRMAWATLLTRSRDTLGRGR
jgi:hypothetical protein